MKRIALVLLGLTGALCGCASGLDRSATDTADIRSLPRARSGASYGERTPAPQRTGECLGDAGACQ